MLKRPWLKTFTGFARFFSPAKEDVVLFETVQKILNNFYLEALGLFLKEVAVLDKAEQKNSEICISLRAFIPLLGLKKMIEAHILSELKKQEYAVLSVNCAITFSFLEEENASRLAKIRGVKHIIAVASGKGGVGKSTTAVNLALALHCEGARVALLDADIYGPSQPMMLGVKEGVRPQMINENTFAPVMAHGIQSMSIGYLVDERTPMVWRGPMATGALQQLIMQTAWDDVDYLIVDMPPGTGDIQLTLSQKVPISGAVIITTPQDIALLDAKRAIEMFQKVEVPVLGVVENMSYHTCSSCGHHDAIFGEGGGESLSTLYHVGLLGQLPLSRHIREQVDGGMPTVIAEPAGDISGIYHQIARKAAAQLFFVLREADVPEIIISED